ncbi:MAG: YicC/YloC family endoribonuclease [bacterium]
MIVSLTGFGRAEVEDGDLRFSVEVRSVNNRFLEIGTKLPRSLVNQEMEFRALVRNRVDRGKVNLFIQEDRSAIRQTKLNFDQASAKALADGLRELAQSAGVKDDLTLSDLVHLMEWFTGENDDEDSGQRLALAKRGIEAAFDEFDRMRAEEGNNLEADFRQRLESIFEVLAKVETKTDTVRESQLEKLRERIERYVTSDQVDESRLEQEVAYILDRLDITEEIVRLRSHIQLFHNALEGGGSVGKRLNFILQEMNREINTIGSKCQDAETASWVVEMKDEAEKIREQVQNVA